jgi:hypothetical protein
MEALTPGPGRGLSHLRAYDRHAPLATKYLIADINANADRHIAHGRQRLTKGFETYPNDDGPLMVLTPLQLLREADEEIADWYAYATRFLHLTLSP